jgi:hypothetical protein
MLRIFVFVIAHLRVIMHLESSLKFDGEIVSVINVTLGHSVRIPL